ncbi:MAG: polysaccharide export protein [Xanthobacteraceae bacterium]|nr:polysaccharide export protein [Xanthobacteraceae bacterium]
MSAISFQGVARGLFAASISIIMSNCAGFTPQDAPNAVSVNQNAALITEPTAPLPYALVPINAQVLQASNSITDTPVSTFTQIPGGNYRNVTIGVGDILAITVFEAQAGGLFIPKEASVRPGNFVDIPRQQVDESGHIVVPYAGSLKASGLTPSALAHIIREKIKDRAVDPQAVVSVVEQRGVQVNVLGEVNSPLRFPIDPGGIHLLSAIARAGGPKYPAYETKIKIKRAGRIYTQPMASVLHRASEDVLLAPGDVVFLTREPRVFMVFGSTPSPGAVGGVNDRRFAFDNFDMTLAEALAKAGGLDGTRSDSRSVYLFRFEPKELLESAGVEAARFPTRAAPTAYAFDMSKPDGMFLAEQFRMRDQDMIVVSESPGTEFIKLMTVLNSATTNAYNIGQTIQGLR